MWYALRGQSALPTINTHGFILSLSLTIVGDTVAHNQIDMLQKLLPCFIPMLSHILVPKREGREKESDQRKRVRKIRETGKRSERAMIQG